MAIGSISSSGSKAIAQIPNPNSLPTDRLEDIPINSLDISRKECRDYSVLRLIKGFG